MVGFLTAFILPMAAATETVLSPFERDDRLDEYLESVRQEGPLSWHVVNRLRIRSRDTASPTVLNRVEKIAFQSRDLSSVTVSMEDLPKYRKNTDYSDSAVGYGIRTGDGDSLSMGVQTAVNSIGNGQCHDFNGCRHLKVSFVATTREQCQWTTENDAEPVTGPCNGHDVFLRNGDPTQITVSDGVQTHTDTVRPILKTFIALGDSYISGEGLGDWLNKTCRNSPYAWPALVAARYALEHPHTAVDFVSTACSGAETQHILQRSQHDRQNPGRSQLDENIDRRTTLKWREGQYQDIEQTPDIILLSTGGNDAQFGDTIKDALLGNVCVVVEGRPTLKTKYVEYVSTALQKTLPKLYAELASNLLNRYDSAQIVATVYPSPIHESPTRLCSTTAFDVESATARTAPMLVTTDEFSALGSGFIHPFLSNEGLPEIAKNATAKLVESQRERWQVVQMTKLNQANHIIEPEYANGFCKSGQGIQGSWFNRFSDSVSHIESFSGTAHPNIYGQLYYAAKVYEQLFD